MVYSLFYGIFNPRQGKLTLSGLVS
jgi:hypothetical protein